MTRFATLLALAALTAPLALAQPARTNNGALTDQVYARDIGGATVTLDGTLNEPEWANAETIELTYGGTGYLPGGGWETQNGPFTLDAPTDGASGTLRLLRKGNMVYVGLTVRDKSIGGSRDFFPTDGLFMAMLDGRRRDATFARADTAFVPNYGQYSNTTEVIYSWINRGVGSLPAGADSVGMAPTVGGNANLDRGSDTERLDPDLLAVSYTINGVANDDFNGTAVATEDVGYVMELSINAETLGFNLNLGDALPITFGLYDRDYSWPGNDNLRYASRAYFQNPFGNQMNRGVSYVVGDPAVTVTSGPVPAGAPDVSILRTRGIVVDGQLTESAWNGEAPVSLKYKMTKDELDELPGAGPLHTHWFRPGADATIPVVDASTGDFRFAYEGTTLYVALDSDDAAISGNTVSEARNDGFRLTIRDLTPTTPRAEFTQYEALQFTAVVDSTGSVSLLQDARDNAGVTAAAFLKPGSTSANPTDIDQGYSIEMSIDLSEVGIDMSEGLLWIGATYFDGDDLDPAENSYGTRTWWLTERGGGAPGPSARAFLDTANPVAGEDGPNSGDALRVLGNRPNPFSATTQVRYELAAAANVTVEVYDVLGRQVQTVQAGLQTAGAQTATIDASGLSAGSYVYRIRLDDGTSVSGQMMVIR